MAVRSRQMVPSTASQVLIRVDSRDTGNLAGLLYNPYLDRGARFDCVVDFAKIMDAMFDELNFPQAATAYRGVGKKAPAPAAVAGQAPEKLALGDAGVFVVHVQFRQNADWQGTIRWPGQNMERRFRSTLELFKLMDEAPSP